MYRTLLTTSFAILAASVLQAQIASDNAANYGGTWANGNNPGSGFLPWSIVTNAGGGLFAGSFVGSSTAGAGDINTSGVSLGLFANPASAFVNADRAFAVSLSAGQSFTFELALNFDNGNKGFNLYAGSQGQVFNFNVGGGASVSASSGASLVAGPGAGYDYGDNAVLDVTIDVLSATQFAYEISRSSNLGFQGVLFSGTVSGLTEELSGFRFYVSSTVAGIPQNDLYINNLSVVPEPGSVLLAGAAGTLLLLQRRRKIGV